MTATAAWSGGRGVVVLVVGTGIISGGGLGGGNVVVEVYGALAAAFGENGAAP